MSTILNTSYKVQADVDTDVIRNQYNVEEGAYVTTESGVWTVYNGAWVKLYPQGGVGSGLGWTRYDDGEYTSASKFSLADGVEVVIPHNGANVYRSQSGIDYYNDGDIITLYVLTSNNPQIKVYGYSVEVQRY